MHPSRFCAEGQLPSRLPPQYNSGRDVITRGRQDALFLMKELSYRGSMKTAAHCGPPRPTAAHRGPPRPTAAHRGPPRPTAAHCGPLRPTAAHCGPLHSLRRLRCSRVSLRMMRPRNLPRRVEQGGGDKLDDAALWVGRAPQLHHQEGVGVRGGQQHPRRHKEGDLRAEHRPVAADVEAVYKRLTLNKRRSQIISTAREIL